MIKKSKLMVCFLTLVMVVAVMMSMSIAVFADYGIDGHQEVVSTGSVTAADIQNAIKYANQHSGLAGEHTDDEEELYVKVKGQAWTLMKFDGSNSVSIDKDVWKDAKDRDVTKVMRLFVDSIKESSDADAVTEFMGYFRDTNREISSVMLTMVFDSTQADLYSAYKIVEPIVGVVNIILGVGCVALIFILLGSTVIDLAYIGLPVFREAAENGKNKGKHPFGVSYEALRTVDEIEKGLGGADGEYRNAYLLYFRRRALTYIILAVCIMYLICGGISGIIGFILSLTSGITG